MEILYRYVLVHITVVLNKNSVVTTFTIPMLFCGAGEENSSGFQLQPEEVGS